MTSQPNLSCLVMSFSFQDFFRYSRSFTVILSKVKNLPFLDDKNTQSIFVVHMTLACLPEQIPDVGVQELIGGFE